MGIIILGIAGCLVCLLLFALIAISAAIYSQLEENTGLIRESAAIQLETNAILKAIQENLVASREYQKMITRAMEYPIPITWKPRWDNVSTAVKS